MSTGRRSTSSSGSLFIVVALLMTALSTQMTAVSGGRALRSEALPIVGAGCDQADGGQSGAGIASFVASSSSNGEDFSVSLQGLMFRLASGPSKRGPGH
ncbi:unnamed protein product [Linum trigynum]|uniref:Uncharacterized protein n=1 Tax=Linum trigynum TaxID=586398 RepID=A0AAV2FCP6_9ROSI